MDSTIVHLIFRFSKDSRVIDHIDRIDNSHLREVVWKYKGSMSTYPVAFSNCEIYVKFCKIYLYKNRSELSLRG